MTTFDGIMLVDNRLVNVFVMGVCSLAHKHDRDLAILAAAWFICL